MSTHVTAFKPPDEKHKQMLAAWEACRAAGVDPPDAVLKHFMHRPPDRAGVVVDEDELRKLDAVRDYRADGESGLEVHLNKLPKGVDVLRFVNLW